MKLANKLFDLIAMIIANAIARMLDRDDHECASLVATRVAQPLKFYRDDGHLNDQVCSR